MNPTIEQELALAKVDRRLALQRLNDLLVAATLAQTDSTKFMAFEARYQRLPQYENDFETAQRSIVRILVMTHADEAELAEEDSFRKTADEYVYSSRTIFLEFSSKAAISVPSPRSASQASPQSSGMRLPRIQLPVFSGNYRDFPNFMDLFENVVHNNTGISEIEKFQYLTTSLSGEALAVVKSLPLSTSNYAIAYQQLKDRYDNPRLLATSHWREITDCSKVNSESSYNELRKLLNIFTENVAALKNLNFPTNEWSFILLNTLLQKIDPSTRKRFELKYPGKNIPTYADLHEFLTNQCDSLEAEKLTSQVANLSCQNSQKPAFQPKRRTALVTSTDDGTARTCMCRPNCGHLLTRCDFFKRATPKERFQFVKNQKLCLNCFGADHAVFKCGSSFSCRTCSSKHHSLLHFDDQGAPTSLNALTNSSGLSHQTVLLGTAKAEVLDDCGSPHPIRILIDCGSQSHFISKSCVKRLGLKVQDSEVPIVGIGESRVTEKCRVTTCKIRPTGLSNAVFKLDCCVIAKICAEMPTAPFGIENFSHIKGLNLADNQFNLPAKVDLLIGAEIFPEIMRPGKIQADEPNQPAAFNTIFGHVMMGRVETSCSKTRHCMAAFSEVDTTLKRFWEVESVPQICVASEDDEFCERIFMEKTQRSLDGKYSVPLPFRSHRPVFEDSREAALRRLLSLERRLAKDPILRKAYSDYMKDFEFSGDMTVVEPPSKEVLPRTYYIPHLCVLKPDARTSKLRVVFDAGSKDPRTHTSLNSTLHSGPKLQQDVNLILLRFRANPVALTCDVKGMYRGILVNDEDRDYQRILWRYSPDDEVQEYRINVVVFGVSSAPYLALRVMKQLAEDYKDEYPLAAELVSSSMYIDDIVCSLGTVSEALRAKEELIELFRRARFELHKWTSNQTALVPDEKYDCKNQPSLTFEDDVKILGIKWNPNSDFFTYKINSRRTPCTKRHILSELARMYDPLGFCCPVTFWAKFLIQLLWTLGMEWDETPPQSVVTAWVKFKEQLPLLEQLRIPRMLREPESEQCQLHCFSDASEKGYGAVIYLRTINKDCSVQVTLVCAKSKVAPLKKMTIPRLELCAAVLLARLLEFVRVTFQRLIELSDIYAWTDSTVTLAWLQSPPYKWVTFVANRVAFVQAIIAPEKWRHVPGKNNPADSCSRGLMPEELMNDPLWWRGPAFLLKPETDWPARSRPDESVREEIKSQRIALIAQPDIHFIDGVLERISSLRTAKRAFGYVLRYIHNKLNPKSKKVGALTFEELQMALKIMIRHVQQTSFEAEITCMQSEKRCSKAFRKLSPFFDSEGLLRVGGRLAHSNLRYEAKHPILLPKKGRLTHLIIVQCHIEHLHCGPGAMHGILSQSFWIVSGKKICREIFGRCVTCFKTNPKPMTTKMGDLPLVRVTQAKAFTRTGVDFCGPFLVTMSKHRGVRTSKAYISVFVCMATKACHLELVSDMSAPAFLAAFRRFVGRRGTCTDMYSDQGTNFVGSHKELRECGVTWHFNPPGAPHMGGLWEAGVKSVKTHLRRVIGQQILTYEELNTLLIRIESVLNSRPLYAHSDSPDDLTPLTPGHFLTLAPLSAYPEPPLPLKINNRDRWQLIQRMHQEFWRRWSAEYLHTLQARHKWDKGDSRELKLGSLVLIKEENLPPLTWRLARVTLLHPGSDGVVRVATLQTSTGVIQRPVVKLCPLPVTD